MISKPWSGWVWGILSVGLLHAQDLVWTELEVNVVPPVLATDVKISGVQIPSVPAEIKKLAEIAYAEVVFVTDPKGQGLVRSPLATSPWLLQAAEEGLVDCRIKPTESGKARPSYHETRCYLIFNPKSAALRSPNSTPRALVVRSAIFPTEESLKQSKKRLAEDLPRSVFADVTVSETGAVTEVAPIEVAQSELAKAVVAAVKEWQFAPARRDGSPYSTTVRVPVLIAGQNIYNTSDLTKPPRAIKQTRPVYPISERIGRFRGEVMVDFVVTSRGEVRDVTVHQSNNPNFNEPAIQAVREWKFEPGLVGNRPVNARMRVPMVFTLDGIGSSERYEVTQKNSSKLPQDLQNDYPPRVKNVALGVYPFEQLQKETRATVNVNFIVRPDGKVTFRSDKDKVLSDFDRAARAMIEEFEFVPASKNGQPNWGLLKMEVNFDLGNEQVPVSSSARHILRELRKNEPAIVQANQLDRSVEVVASHSPKYPSDLIQTQVKGQAVIEFFIDEEGLVQLPRIISATDPAFGYAGAQALSRWRFKPPLRKGKAVIVKARMPFVFTPEPIRPDSEKAASPSSSGQTQ